MSRLWGNIFAVAASLASLLGLYFTLAPSGNDRPLWHLGLIAVAVVASVYLIVAEAVEYYHKAPKSFKSNDAINTYMRNWLKSGGRSLIFSRDMSWADEPTTRDILISKANRGELVLCVEHEMPLATSLRQAGAKIIRYGELNHVPRSRFTIVDFEKDGARVAIGGHVNGAHLIQEYQSGQHPLFALADDLAKILMKYNEHQNGV